MTQHFSSSNTPLLLSPPTQAEQVLGERNQPDANKVKEFIHNEIEFSYGRGCVASVNPVSAVCS